MGGRPGCAPTAGWALLCAASVFGPVRAQSGPPPSQLPGVEVVGTSPMPGSMQPLADVPTNARVYFGRALEGAGPAGTGRLLDDRAASVTVDDSVGNRRAADISFRGFTASPLLGSAQGLSVFLDGVRINESFGDVVNWDLIPRNALASVSVLPGSAPSFGLNTLGGAVSMTTRSGATDPGTEAVAGGGSFGQRSIEFSHGAASGAADWFIAGTAANEDGWRDYSSSSIRQIFGKAGWTLGRTRFEVSAGGADNALNGTQALPASWLDTPKEPYTWPDRTDNRLAYVNGLARHALASDAEVSLRLFLRNVRQRGFNSNVNDACADAPCTHNAFNDANSIDDRRHGLALQGVGRYALAQTGHRLMAGASSEQGRVRFEGASQAAEFTTHRGTTGLEDFAVETATRTRQRYDSLYLADTVSVDALRVTAALTYVGTRIEVRDTSGQVPELDGDHRFSRWLPALGATWSAPSGSTWFGSVGHGMRAPTAVELTCADPDAPCRLPNLFLADPPLKAVRSRSYEAGVRLRGMVDRVMVRGSAALFRVDLRDDIQFVSAGGAATNAGYFRNVGRTRRQGGEASIQAVVDAFSVEASYMLLHAVFADGFTAYSPNNSSANAGGNIDVAAGDRLPGLPRQTFKLHASWQSPAGSAVGLTLVGYGSRSARGDENNRDASGAIPGYALVHLDGSLAIANTWRVVAEVRNLFDRRYQSGGVLGANFFTGPDRSFSPAYAGEAFRTPGSARSFWLGLRYAVE